MSLENSVLACSSTRGTVHIFSITTNFSDQKNEISLNMNDSQFDEIVKSSCPEALSESAAALESQNSKSMFASFASVLPSYFSREFSFAKFRVGDQSLH